MSVTRGPLPLLKAALLLTITALLSLVLAAPASAAAPAGSGSACAGRTVPISKISVQLFTFAAYIGNDGGSVARHGEVLEQLAAMGYRNVEPYTFSGLTAEQYKALLDEHGLKASARHVNVGTPASPVDITSILRDNKVLGIKYFGSGGTPRTYTTAAQWEAYAAYLDRLGEQARKAGQTLMVHNHNWEFASVGDGLTGYDVLVQGTQAKNVALQLDVYWAAFAGLDPAAVVREYGNRIELLHVKDLNRELGNRIEIVGRGDLDFPSIFSAAGGSTKYYVVEHDPRRTGDPFDPFQAAREGFAYLTCTTF